MLALLFAPSKIESLPFLSESADSVDLEGIDAMKLFAWSWFELLLSLSPSPVTEFSLDGGDKFMPNMFRDSLLNSSISLAPDGRCGKWFDEVELLPPRADSITRFIVSMSRIGGPPGFRGCDEVLEGDEDAEADKDNNAEAAAATELGTLDIAELLYSPFSRFSKYLFLGGLGVELEFVFILLDELLLLLFVPLIPGVQSNCKFVPNNEPNWPDNGTAEVEVEDEDWKLICGGEGGCTVVGDLKLILYHLKCGLAFINASLLLLASSVYFAFWSCSRAAHHSPRIFVIRRFSRCGYFCLTTLRCRLQNIRNAFIGRFWDWDEELEDESWFVRGKV